MKKNVEAVVLLSRVLDQTGDVLARIHEEQLSDPTPCRDWDVGRLVAHVVTTPGRFRSAAQGREPDPPSEATPPPIAWTTAFRSAADDLIHAWHQAGEDVDPDVVDAQTAEFAVHSWDLARATGQAASVDDEVAERALAFLSRELTPQRRDPAFAAPAPAEDDASLQDRLAAYAGRPLH